MQSALTHLECSQCRKHFDFGRAQATCPDDGSPLLARYDLRKAGWTLDPAGVRTRPGGLWRWAELLPLQYAEHRVTLGEGDSPVLPIRRLGDTWDMKSISIKDESKNPTGTFKARGLSVAVSKAVELGMRHLVIPTAGNAGGALAAYAARAGILAHVFMPRDAPLANRLEVATFGADLVLVDGLIGDAGRHAAQAASRNGWFDVSTFNEPYRLEGKKTMGLELAENFNWDLPDVVIYPTGGGTGLVGMWKAFEELEGLGWIGARRPRMVAVQASGCAPVVRAMESGADRVHPWQNAATVAAGLRVPAPFADRLILQVLRESRGTAVAVSDEEILSALDGLAAVEGLLAAPEGAATWAALRRLVAQGWIGPQERVVLFNTGSGLKYL